MPNVLLLKVGQWLILIVGVVILTSLVLMCTENRELFTFMHFVFTLGEGTMGDFEVAL